MCMWQLHMHVYIPTVYIPGSQSYLGYLAKVIWNINANTSLLMDLIGVSNTRNQYPSSNPHGVVGKD